MSRFPVLIACLVFAFPISAEGQTKAPKSADDLKRFKPFGYAIEKHDVTISGRAVDDDGKPVAGAKVFVIPVMPRGFPYSERGIIAEGKTDTEGRYQFDDVALSVLEFAPSAVPKPTEALFQVFAIADGYGYMWRRAHAYRPEPRPADEKVDAEMPAFYADEPIVLDLTFSPEIRLHGVITDDAGNPLEGATVQVGFVTSSRDLPGAPPNTWHGEYHPDSARGLDRSFAGFHVLPEPYRLARTDAEGKYEIRGIPRDCRFLCCIDYRPEFEALHTTLVSGNKVEFRELLLTESGELNHVFARPKEVRVKLLAADRSPISDVIVRRDPQGRVSRGGALERTGDDGEASLHLMPGSAKLLVEPSIGVPFLPRELDVEVRRDEEPLELELKLERAAEVVFQAVDHSTGLPVSGVALLCEEVDSGQRSPLQSQLSFVDHPRTDDRGRLQAFLRPGAWRFAVDQRRSARGFEPLAPVSKAFELTAGKPTEIRFEFSPRTLPADEAPLIAAELKPLVDLLERQRAKFEAHDRFRFRVRRHNFLTGTYSPAQMGDLLDSLNGKSLSECLISLRRAFPDLRRLAESELICDGPRRRVTMHRGDEQPAEVNLFNGEEMVISMDAGRQIDLYTRENCRIHFLDRRDIWDGPVRPATLQARKPPAGQDEPERTVRHVEGAWEISSGNESSYFERTIDDATGLDRRFMYGTKGHPVSESRQYFPMLLESGIAYPRLAIKVNYQQEDQVRCEVTVIDSVEILESVPPETFMYAAPAGTNILDYRRIPRDEQGRGRRAPSGVVAVDVPDVIAHRNRFEPPAEPVLKVGDQMPDLKVSSWLTAEGPATAPAFAGKTLVIDFWGIGCGPCIAQLPEVNAAAKHFARSEILVIGLHDSSGSVEKVTEFAKKKGLAFPTAIDTADRVGSSFGVTFASFGISGIPTCVVVDASGKVAYLGEFKEGIEVAHKLAGGK